MPISDVTEARPTAQRPTTPASPAPAEAASAATAPAVTVPGPSSTRLGPVSIRPLGLGRKYPFGWSYGIVALLLIWSVGSILGIIDPRTLPAPWVIVETLWYQLVEGRLPEHMQASVVRAALGFSAGFAVGLVLAVISGLSRLGEGFIDGPVQINRATPGLAMMPLLILWFGIGEDMKIITIALSVMIPIYMHTHNGLRGIDKRYIELAETQKVSRWTFIRHVIFPGSLPGLFLGLRFAVLSSWLSLIVVEQYNATEGIGYMMTLASTYGQTDVIIAGLVVYAALGLALDSGVKALQRFALRWRKTIEG